VDLLDGTLSWRRFWALVENLPADSATARAEIGPEAAWPVEAHLMAGVYDQLALANWQRASIHRGNGRPPERPKAIPRPGVEQPLDGRKLGGKGYTKEEFDAMYAQIIADELVLEEVSLDGS
jgi:hypothetical protein